MKYQTLDNVASCEELASPDRDHEVKQTTAPTSPHPEAAVTADHRLGSISTLSSHTQPQQQPASSSAVAPHRRQPATTTSRRPHYFLVIKYFLLSYLVLHVIWISASLPSGIRDLEDAEHDHGDLITGLWVTSIVLMSGGTVIGCIGIWRELFLTCVTFCLCMLVNLLVLVYGATLHNDHSSAMITSLILNWFVTCVAIAYTKILDTMQQQRRAQSARSTSGGGFRSWHLLDSSPGFLHSVYIRQEHHPMQQQLQQQEQVLMQQSSPKQQQLLTLEL